MSESAIWTPAEPKIIVTSELPKGAPAIGMRSATWRREPFVAEMIRQLDEHPKKFKNWDGLSHKERFATLSKAQYDAVVEQFRWCSEDFSYAARNYFWITDNDGRDTLFTLWESQYLILQKYYDLKSQGKPQKIYILKARQLGASLLIEAMIAWRTMFYPNMEALVVSGDAPHAAYLFGLMLHIYDRMPWWLKPEKASREEKNGVWFDNPDAEKRNTEPGLNSRIYVQWSSQYSGVGQGRKILCCHTSEISDWYQPAARSIIEGDLKYAVKDSPEAFWFVETTGKESGTYSHKLWRGCEKLAEEAQLYPLFLPFFFETKRARPLPKVWQAKKPEISMRERVKNEWVRCLNCLQYFARSAYGRDRHGEHCPSCKTGVIQAVILTDEQIYWREVQRRQAEENGRDAVIEATRELASNAEEAYMAGGVSVFPLECQEAVMATIMDPDKYPGVKVGYFDTRSLEKPRFHGIDGTNPHPSHEDKYCCYLPECEYDHTGDMDQFNMTIWQEPQVGAAYCVGVDVAEGLGQNYSVIFVNKMGSVGPDEQVAVFRDNRIDTLPLAFFCCLIGYYYNSALMCIEYEGIGKSTADAVRLIYQYPNIYQWKHMDSTNIRSNKWHWYTKPDTRQKLWQTARYWIRAGSWVIRSKNFLAEMQTFQKDEEDSKSAGHAAGETDDEIFAGMISLYCVAPETRVLTNDLRWVPIGECGVGDKLISFDEEINCVRGSPCLLRESEITSHKIVYEPRFRIVTDKGEVIASGHHGWATVKYGSRQGKKYNWTITGNLKAGSLIVRINRPWESDNTPDAQWLSGFLDGEGCLRLQHSDLLKFGRNVGRGNLSFAQKPGVALDKALRVCRQLGINTIDRGHTGTSKDVRVVEMRAPSNHSALEIVGRLRPVRLLENSRKIWFDRPFIGWHWPIETATVLEIIPLGIGPVVSVGTTTRTLFTEGLASHNCAHDSDADERGIVRPPIVEVGPVNPLWQMICKNPECGHEFGADRPDQVYRCPRCMSVNLVGKKLESDVGPSADSILDQLERSAPSRDDGSGQNFDAAFL